MVDRAPEVMHRGVDLKVKPITECCRGRAFFAYYLRPTIALVGCSLSCRINHLKP